MILPLAIEFVGSGSRDDLNPSTRLAESILRVMPQAMRVDLHAVIDGAMSETPVHSVAREEMSAQAEGKS